MTAFTTANAIPHTGMLATVHNRCGVIATVEPFDGDGLLTENADS